MHGAVASAKAAFPAWRDASLAKRSQVEDVLQELAGEWAPIGGPSAEDEIARNGWLNVPAPKSQMVDIIFDTPDEYKYDKVLALLGIDSGFLSAEVGHA